MRQSFTKLLLLLPVILFTACCGTEHFTPEVLDAYLKYHEPKQDTDNSFSAYFDLSNGMLSAYASNESTQNALKSIVNKVTGNNNCKNVFTLKNANLENCKLRQTDLYNYILNPASYATTAPIEETLKRIVSDGKSAFLMTDFEEYSNGMIQQQNYAKEYFIDWLKRGNSIYFFITDYIEGTKSKHLYFTVFDTPSHLLLNEIQDALKGTGMQYKTFVLTDNKITFSNNYPAETIGGTYHDQSGEDVVCCTNETGEKDCYTIYKDLNAEFYPFEETWTNIVQNAKDFAEEGNTPKYTHLISGLKADFSLMTGYNVKALDVVTTDVQKDYDKFEGYYDFKVDGQNVGDDGKVLPEFDYEKSPGAVSQVKDMFVFGGKINGTSADIAIDFRPYFSGEVANMPMDDMLRVDVVISDSEPRYDILSELFEWDGNRSLCEAVKNTLQDRNPVGKVIYSYFIKASGK